jgi:DNA-binding winged helix-turn-helix (wHTH) protein/Tfp pilus assembly protein PilF
MDEQTKTSYEFGAFRLVPAERQLLHDGQSVTLPAKAFDTLLILVQNNGHVVKKDDLLKLVWPDAFVEENNLNQYVSLLRKTLSNGHNGERYIETVRGHGYRFAADVRESGDESGVLLVHRRSRAHFVFKEEQSESLKKQTVTSTITDARASSWRAPLLAGLAILTLIGTVAGYFRFVRSANSGRSAAAVAISAAGGKLSDNSTARDAYWQGRYFWNKRTPADIKLAEEFFQKAIAIDPNFALGYVGLADAYLIGDPPKAEASLRKALELDKNLGEAHASLGFFRMFYHWDWPGARAEFEQAVAQSPNYATAHQWYALYLASQARLANAKQEMSKAVEFEPRSPNMHADLGQILYFAHEYNDAIIECHKALELEPNFIFAHDYLNSIYAKKNMYAEAVEEVLMAQRTAGRLSDRAISSQREVFVKTGWSGFLHARLRLTPPEHSPVVSAYLYTMLGEKGRALDELEHAYDAKDFFLTFIKVDPAFDDLRPEPRFQNLLRRMNLD